MLQLYDLDKKKIKGLKAYKDYCIESELSSGDKTLSFLYPERLCNEIVEETYIQNKTDEFVVKSINGSGEWKTIVAVLNVEDLEGKVFESFETVNKTISESLNLALAGTGWTLGTCDVTRRRTVRKTNSSSWEIIQEAKKRYRVDLEFDSLNKKINIFNKRGNDKGVYFSDTLNLRNLDIQGNSYEFYTRIIAIGKDDIRVTLENFQYSKKVKTFLWKDERYTDIDSLREDAQAKLNEISKPYRAFAANVIDLANISNKYEILSYGLGDTVTLISKTRGLREKQRIAKMVEYPDEPNKNTCEIANITLKFEDIQKEFQDTADIVDNITTDDGTVDGSKVDEITTEQIKDFETTVAKITDLTVVNAKIENLYAEKASIGELNAVVANIGELNATKANITELNAVKATITTLEATTAKITDLTAINAKINVLEVDTASIKNLLAGNITGENIQAGGITSDKLTIQNGFITNAMIMNLDVSKINAGTINTNKFIIKSDDGGIEIVGATQQFKDKNNKVRIQMGKDTQGNFNFILRGEDGTTALIDHTGIKKNAIANDLIVSNMISSDAVGEKQIDYSSFSTGFNKDTNTTTLKSTKIRLDNQNQTLDIAFNQLKTQADGTKSLTESNSTTIGIQQGQINTAINNTKIIKDGQTILLKDDYNRTVSTVNSTVETIGNHTSLIDANTGKITKVTTDVTEVKKDLTGITQRVGSTENTVNTVTTTANNALTNANKGINDALLASNKAGQSLIDAKAYTNVEVSKVETKVSSANSEINQLKNKIELKVEASDITNAVTDIKVGGRNYVQLNKVTPYKPYNTAVIDVKNATITITKKASYLTISISGFMPSKEIYTLSGFATLKGKPIPKDFFTVNRANTYNTGYTKVTVDDRGYFVITEEWCGSSSWLFHCPTKDAVGDVTVYDKLVFNKGNKPNDWTPAPEDVDKAIADTITITEDKIKQAKAEIKIETDKITQSVSSVDSKVTTVTTTANKGVADAKIANDKVNGLNIGGRNLFTNSNKEWKGGNEYTGISITAPARANINKEITISADIKANKAGNISFYSLGTISVGFYESKAVTTGWTRIYATGKFTGDANGNCDLSFFGVYGTGLITTVRNIKVELGNKATDYTVAPEDTDAVLSTHTTQISTTNSKVATIETNLNSINLNVSNVTSTVTSHTTSINAVDGKINTAKTGAITEAVGVKDRRGYNDNPQYYFTNYPKRTVEEFKYAHVIGLAQHNSIFGVCTTVVPWAESSGGYPVQTFKSATTPTYERKATSTTAWGAWVQIEDVTGSQNKANTALNTSKTYTETKVSEAKASIKIETDSIKQSVSSVDSKVTTVTTTANKGVADANTASELARALSTGKMLNIDPVFRKATNGTALYNNLGGSLVTWSRISKPSDCPTSSTHCMEGVSRGAGAPGWGGFYFGTPTRANAIFITKIVAKIPVGRNITWGSNATGTGGTSKWLTPIAGTGKYEEYVYKVVCGSTGSFSSTNFFYLTGGATPTTSAPIVFQVAYATVFDVTDNDETLNTHTTQISTTTSKVATIETNLNSITSRVSATETKTNTIDGKVTSHESRINSAEQKITPTSIINSISSTINGGSGAITTTNTVLNKQGLTINNGALMVRNSNGHVIIDGSKYIQYCEMFGNGALALADGQLDKQISIRHGKGYAPDFKGEWLDTGGNVWANPYTEYTWNVSNNHHGVSVVARMWTDTQNINFHLRRPISMSKGTHTMYFRYFILGGVRY